MRLLAFGAQWHTAKAGEYLFYKDDDPSSGAYLIIDGFADLVQLCIFVIVNVTATLLFSHLERQRRLAENRSTENARLSESLRIADERKDEFTSV